MRMWVGPRLEIGSVVRAGVRVESLLLCARQDGPSESEVAYLSSPFWRKKKREREREGPRFFGGAQKYVWGRREMTRNAKNDEERDKKKGWRANKLVADALTAYAETKSNESAASAPNDVIIAGRINAPYFANDFSSFYAFVRHLFSSTRRPPQRKEITFPGSPAD